MPAGYHPLEGSTFFCTAHAVVVSTHCQPPTCLIGVGVAGCYMPMSEHGRGPIPWGRCRSIARSCFLAGSILQFLSLCSLGFLGGALYGAIPHCLRPASANEISPPHSGLLAGLFSLAGAGPWRDPKVSFPVTTTFEGWHFFRPWARAAGPSLPCLPVPLLS